MEYLVTKAFSLKNSKIHDEKWLQELLAGNETLLGLGEIQHVESERKQNNGGRLDLMFQDEAQEVRYCVELQLGATDEAHIIRTIEYWDNERSRNPHIEHIAVIVAEDITTRFLNVIALFNKAIPLVAIQANAHEANGQIFITCVKVLDTAQNIGWEDDNTSSKVTTDRPYWEKKASPKSLLIADKFLEMTKRAMDDDSLHLKYNKQYIGIARSGIADNFVYFQPKKMALNANFKIPYSEELKSQIEEKLDYISYNRRYNVWRVRITEPDLTTHTQIIETLIQTSGKYEPKQSDD
jgi:hypothetical protein